MILPGKPTGTCQVGRGNLAAGQIRVTMTGFGAPQASTLRASREDKSLSSQAGLVKVLAKYYFGCGSRTSSDGNESTIFIVRR